MRTAFVLQASLLLSVVATVSAGEGFPPFSWDHVPVYAQVGIEDSFGPDEYKFLADHFEFMCFSGIGNPRAGAIEPKIAAATRAVKQHNPNAKILMYWAGDQQKGQYIKSNFTYPDRKAFLFGKRNFFDVSREDVRDWWSGVAAKAVRDYGCNGIFVDAAVAFRPNGPASFQVGKERSAILEAGMFSMLKEAKKKMGPDGLIIFNALHAHDQKRRPLGREYLPVTDGAMIEDFQRPSKANRKNTTEYLANTLEAMRNAAKSGKIIILKTWPGFTWFSDKDLMEKPHNEQYMVAKNNITFPLACFLVAAEPNCYFCYTWGWLGRHGTFDWYPEFDKRLGPPKGDAIREGWTYQREFAHASVFVDLENITAKIDWK